MNIKTFTDLVIKHNENNYFYGHQLSDDFLVTGKYLLCTDKIVTGGSSGGTCWGDESEYYSTSYEVTYEVLERFLNKNFPEVKLTFRDFFKIFNLLHTDGFTDYQYYGNYDDCIYYYIDSCALFNLLTNNN